MDIYGSLKVIKICRVLMKKHLWGHYFSFLGQLQLQFYVSGVLYFCFWVPTAMHRITFMGSYVMFMVSFQCPFSRLWGPHFCVYWVPTFLQNETEMDLFAYRKLSLPHTYYILLISIKNKLYFKRKK